MDPMTMAALASAGANIFGSIMGSRSSEKGAQAANAANLASVQQQIAFQRESMQNRHQWEVADLRKAGLNPILSAGGQPPVPSGASTTFQNTKAGRGELGLAVASSIAQLRLTNALIKTEETKQDVNRSQASGSFNLGPLNVPFSTLAKWFGGGSTSSQKNDSVKSDKIDLRQMMDYVNRTAPQFT